MRPGAVLKAAASLVAITLVAGSAQAQGFGVYEHDSCTMARGGATVASPCSGGSAVFFNPAGIVGSANRTNISVGGTMITLDFKFTDSVSANSTPTVKNNIPVPAAYLTRQLSDRMAVGIGVYAPYGLIVEWPTDFAGRFLSYRADLASINIQPTVAFRPIPRLSIGAGLVYAHTKVTLNQRVDLSSQAAAPGVTFADLGVPLGTDFADAEVTGTANNFGGHFGVLFQVNDMVSLGARYLMRMRAEITGDAAFTQIPTGILLPPGNPLGAPGGTPLDAVLASQFSAGKLRTQGAQATIPMPDQLVVGIAVRPTTGLMLLADWQYVNWKVFEQLPLSFDSLGTRTLNEDYVSTNGYRFGVEYQATPSLALRGGYLYHQAAAPAQTVTPLLPEGERVEYTAGIGFHLNSRVRLDLAYQRIQQADRRGRVVDPPVRGPTGASVNSGLYTGTANLFGASVALGF